MKARCIEIEGYQFSRKDVREGITNRVKHKGLTLNKSYEVYGMIIFQDGLDYLILDDHVMPMWYSAELFEVDESLLPSKWFYRFFGYDKFEVTAIWGYFELVNSQEHFDGLAEQNKQDLELFLKRVGEQY